jgi:DNA-binding transcriptional LysR family regulator
MELRHLRYFIEVAEAENVSRAALKLHVSQPALSRQIRDLEDELGFELLERTAKSVRLTEAGRTFLEESKAVIARAAEATARAKEIANRSKSELRLGYAPSLSVSILPHALRLFQQKVPNGRVLLHDLSSEEMLGGLREGKLHAALLAKPVRASVRGLRFEELARYRMRVALDPGHRLASLSAIALQQIASEPLIAYSRKDYPEYHEELERLFATAKAKPKIAEEHDGVTSLVAAVEAGRGIALVPESMDCFAGPRLKLVSLNPAPAPIIVGLACATGRAEPAVQKFFESARAAAAAERTRITSGSALSSTVRAS